MRSTSLLVAAASVADALVVQPSVQLPPMLTSRVSAPSMQFGFQNYDRTVEKPNRDKSLLNFVKPFATGSTEYPYGQKELKKSISVGGIDVPTGSIDPRARVVVALLGLLGFLPLFVLSIALATPGTRSPFQFLDFVYPPAVDAKNAKAGILTLPFSNNEEKEKALKAKKEADAAAKKTADAEAKAKKEAEAKVKAEKAGKEAEAKKKKEASSKAAQAKAKAAEEKAKADAAAAAEKAKAAEEKAKADAAAAAAKEEADLLAAKQKVIDDAAKAKADAKAKIERERYEDSAEYRRKVYQEKNAALREENLSKQAKLDEAKAVAKAQQKAANAARAPKK